MSAPHAQWGLSSKLNFAAAVSNLEDPDDPFARDARG
jgi:hypothetical protein